MAHHKLAYIWLSALTLFSVFLLYFFTEGQQEFVYIDSQQLLSEYKGMQAARQEYQQKTAGWQANIDTLMKEVQVAIMDYEKESPKMTQKEQELSRELIKTKQQQLKDYQYAIKNKSAQEDQAITQRVLTTINAFLTDYGKQHHYTIIFGATTAGNIIYAKDAVNITEEVIALLNAQYQPGLGQ